MKKSIVVLMAVGFGLIPLGVCLAVLTRTVSWTLLIAVGLCLIGVGAERLIPKYRCPVCGHSLRPPRYPKGGPPEGCYRCPKCGAFVPYR